MVRVLKIQASLLAASQVPANGNRFLQPASVVPRLPGLARRLAIPIVSFSMVAAGYHSQAKEGS